MDVQSARPDVAACVADHEYHVRSGAAAGHGNQHYSGVRGLSGRE